MFEREYDSNGDPRSDYRPVRGDCWLCNGTGRIVKIGCTKLVGCAECRGTGWLGAVA